MIQFLLNNEKNEISFSFNDDIFCNLISFLLQMMMMIMKKKMMMSLNLIQIQIQIQILKNLLMKLENVI